MIFKYIILFINLFTCNYRFIGQSFIQIYNSIDFIIIENKIKCWQCISREILMG